MGLIILLFYILTIYNMPNWNSNGVTINAPLSEVSKYLVFNADKSSAQFNMHMLFPKTFNSDDLTGDKGWDYDWAADNTWAKWFLHTEVINDLSNNQTYLGYETARCPNNHLLKKLHDLTGWNILNQYDEPNMNIRWSFICEDWDCFEVVLA